MGIYCHFRMLGLLLAWQWRKSYFKKMEILKVFFFFVSLQVIPLTKKVYKIKVFFFLQKSRSLCFPHLQYLNIEPALPIEVALMVDPALAIDPALEKVDPAR